MKIRELDFFDEDIRQEFCAYLKQYFNDECEVEWRSINVISASITFKDGENASSNEITVRVDNNCTIYLYKVSVDVNSQKFIKYINVFLDREYTPKKYIKKKDMQQIFSFYNELKIAFKKDKIESFYNAIQRSIVNKNRYYLFNMCIIETDDRAKVIQEIKPNRAIDFKITINTKTGIECVCTFSLDYDELNVLDIARKLAQLQLNLERFIKWSGIVWMT